VGPPGESGERSVDQPLHSCHQTRCSVGDWTTTKWVAKRALSIFQTHIRHKSRHTHTHTHTMLLVYLNKHRESQSLSKDNSDEGEGSACARECLERLVAGACVRTLPHPSALPTCQHVTTQRGARDGGAWPDPTLSTRDVHKLRGASQSSRPARGPVGRQGRSNLRWSRSVSQRQGCRCSCSGRGTSVNLGTLRHPASWTSLRRPFPDPPRLPARGWSV
jgi:hypothetical protein